MTLHAPETLREALGFILRRQMRSGKAAVAVVSLLALGGAWQVHAARSSDEAARLSFMGDEAFLAASASSSVSGQMGEIEMAALPAPGPGRHGGALFRSASELAPASARESGELLQVDAASGGLSAGARIDEAQRAAIVPRIAPITAARAPSLLREAPMPDDLFAYADPHPSAPRAYAPEVGGLSAGASTFLTDSRAALGPQTVEIEVKQNDTLLLLLTGHGVSETEAELAVSGVYGGEPRSRLREGDRVVITYVPDDRSGSTLQRLDIFDRDKDKHVVRMRWISSAANFWEEPPRVGPSRAAAEAPASAAPSAAPTPAPKPAVPAAQSQASERMFQASVRGNIYDTGVAQGLTPRQIAQFVEMFRHSVDFERDIRMGDTFEIMFARRPDELGVMADGPILFAALNARGKRHAFYRFELDDGRAGYFDEKGESNRRAIIRTPVEGRISSRFGNRRHPISGYTRMHQGVDFAAPSGTPIIAAGDGVVTRRGWVGGYGNYVEIKHNNQFTTAYAHMSRFNDEVKRGSRVRQGQVIGYVGSTGNSTGPHLHFEVVKDNVKIDPMKLQDIGGLKLEKTELAEFQSRRDAISAKMKAYIARLP